MLNCKNYGRCWEHRLCIHACVYICIYMCVYHIYVTLGIYLMHVFTNISWTYLSFCYILRVSNFVFSHYCDALWLLALNAQRRCCPGPLSKWFLLPELQMFAACRNAAPIFKCLLQESLLPLTGLLRPLTFQKWRYDSFLCNSVTW